LKQGKYISGDERWGFKLSKVNLPLPDARLRLFLEGKEDWLEGALPGEVQWALYDRIMKPGTSQHSRWTWLQMTQRPQREGTKL
jgi:hypothetical protein